MNKFGDSFLELYKEYRNNNVGEEKFNKKIDGLFKKKITDLCHSIQPAAL